MRRNQDIGHVRYASVGGNTLENTHPFVRVFRRREVALARNGTLRWSQVDNPLKFHPVGKTDSEQLLCALLTKLSKQRIDFTDLQGIQAVLRSFNGLGTMNVLFSEGDHLYCHRDQAGTNGLCKTERNAPIDKVSLRDEDWEVDLAEEKRSDQRGFVIATRPLTNEQWNHLAPGSLCLQRWRVCLWRLTRRSTFVPCR
jgi:glutamine amidotransferase